MDAETVTKKHPIRGALYGLSLGIGVAVYLIIFAIVEFSATTSIIAVVACVFFGILWGLFAPAKKPKGAPPAKMEHEMVPTMADAGFDTVGDESVEAATPPGSGLAPPPASTDAAEEGGSEDPI